MFKTLHLVPEIISHHIMVVGLPHLKSQDVMNFIEVEPFDLM